MNGATRSRAGPRTGSSKVRRSGTRITHGEPIRREPHAEAPVRPVPGREARDLENVAARTGRAPGRGHSGMKADFARKTDVFRGVVAQRLAVRVGKEANRR